MKKTYEVPIVSVLNLAVEQGFAATFETGGENGNWVGTQSAEPTYEEYL